MKEIRILSTKKLHPNQKQFLLNAGFSVVDADFIKTKSVPFEIQDVKQNLIFTSSNAVKSIIENDFAGLKEKQCFCVGQKTKELLEQNGFSVKESAENASSLGKKINGNHKNESFTFFTGNLTLEILPEILEEAKITHDLVEVYETTLTPVRIKARFDGILFFSPSGIESYLNENTITNETCFCIGTTTAKALQNITNNIIIANQPSVENTIIQTINHYKKA